MALLIGIVLVFGSNLSAETTSRVETIIGIDPKTSSNTFQHRALEYSHTKV
jgi:hypothetical protein